ncbi:MAG: flagellar filament capping protein FliD [Kiritimatiellae bacterium]|nr:flagellar filament capping protein FliD [Kiritimatiellia bacterium]
MAEIHMGGLVSGTDVQGIIDQLLELQQKPIDTKNEEKVAIQADIAAWADISTDMSALTDALNVLRGLDAWNGVLATSSDTGKLTATATSSAAETVYDIVIDWLADAHSVRSAKASDLSGGADANTDLITAGVLTRDDTFTIGTGATQQTITIGRDDGGAAVAESLASLRTKINNAAENLPASERMFAVIIDDHLVITREQTGSQTLQMADSSGTALDDLDIFDTSGDEGSTWENQLVAPRQAQFSANGITVNRDANTGLTDVIEGVTLNLLAPAAAADNLTLSVARDTETPKTAILDFMEAYNTVVEKMEGYREVTIDDSNTEEDEPTVGELQDDYLVREILYNLRRLAGESKYPAMNALNASYTYGGKTGILDNLLDIGVSTTGQQNRLSLEDEDRLDYLLQNHFDELEQLFRGVWNPAAGRYENGVALDLYAYSDATSTSLTGSIARRTATLNDQIDRIDESIEKMLEDIDREEQRYWEMFGAMEDAIAKMQQELSWLTGQLGVS